MVALGRSPSSCPRYAVDVNGRTRSSLLIDDDEGPDRVEGKKKVISKMSTSKVGWRNEFGTSEDLDCVDPAKAGESRVCSLPAVCVGLLPDSSCSR